MRISALITLIKQKQLEIADSMAQGHCSNFESYLRLTGRHAGLEETMQIINNLLEEEKRDDI
jgi:hypothetical protein